MKVGLHDADVTKFPNLALMKLSAYHKNRGDEVIGFDPNLSYDRVYSSKVFTFTPETAPLPADTKRGGVGYGDMRSLPPEIESLCPDYTLYDLDYSMGFLTRGCNRTCAWCFVPEKEGKVRPGGDIADFARHRDVVLLDNNVLQHDHGIQQIEKIAKLGLRVDFNQGLDARLIDDGIARLLAKVKWLKPVRLACDHSGQMKSIQKAVTLMRWHNVTPRRYFCYCLIDDVEESLDRIKFLKAMYLDPFAQPFIDREGTAPSKLQRGLARWVNHKAVFNAVTWTDYCAEKGLQ